MEEPNQFYVIEEDHNIYSMFPWKKKKKTHSIRTHLPNVHVCRKNMVCVCVYSIDRNNTFWSLKPAWKPIYDSMCKEDKHAIRTRLCLREEMGARSVFTFAVARNTRK